MAAFSAAGDGRVERAYGKTEKRHAVELSRACVCRTVRNESHVRRISGKILHSTDNCLLFGMRLQSRRGVHEEIRKIEQRRTAVCCAHMPIPIE